MATTAYTPAFTADQFAATQWETAETKVEWANHFMRFWLSGFRKSLFTKAFYCRLSMTYGHIAHYNRAGFWAEFFADEAGRIRFMAHTLNYIPVGDPAWTYSDVERAIQIQLSRYGL